MCQKGFTLIELVVVVTIIGIAAAILSINFGAFSYWNEETFLRKFAETLEFLHHQAVQDGEHYQVEINFKNNSYRIGVLKTEEYYENSEISEAAQDEGSLSLELAAYLNPHLGKSHSLIPPPSFPSMAEPVTLPQDVTFEDVRNMSGLIIPSKSQSATISFSPRGFSEFAVVHLRFGQSPVTILINPFSGLTEVYREYKDFQWTYNAEPAQ